MGRVTKRKMWRKEKHDLVCFPTEMQPTSMFDDLMLSPTDHGSVNTLSFPQSMCSLKKATVYS